MRDLRIESSKWGSGEVLLSDLKLRRCLSAVGLVLGFISFTPAGQAQGIRAEATTVTIEAVEPDAAPADSGTITINVPRSAKPTPARQEGTPRATGAAGQPAAGAWQPATSPIRTGGVGAPRSPGARVESSGGSAVISGQKITIEGQQVKVSGAERGAATARIQSIPSEPSYLQGPIVETSSPTVSRGGVTLPLRPEMLPEKPMALTVPTVNVTTLTNGIVLYHYQSKDLPRVQVSVLMNAGTRLDPADKLGLAELTARTVRSGGSAGVGGDDIDRQLEQIGSDFTLTANKEYTGGTLFALTENLDKAMKILTDILLRPELDPARLEKQRELMLENIRRQNDEPADISRREFRKIAYGSEHWLARTPTPSQVKSITRDDVRKFYEEWYRPASLRLGVSGDISKEDARKLIESALLAWNKPAAQVPPRAAVAEDRDTTGGVYYIRKMTAQSQIRMGHLGMARLSPDIYAVTILNGVYGTGGFSSRLMNRVRTKRGFVYGVGGGVMSDDPRGLFMASAASKSKTTAAAVEEILDVTRELLSGDISEEEIETSKRDNVFSFLTEFARPSQIVDKYMQTDFQGFPPDYLQTYIERLKAVTKEQVVEMARKYIHPDRLKIMVIGFEKQFDKPVATFGAVNEVKLDVPE
ncbi:MAG: M16 family metallopeptidase [Candidatus Sumerlaeaceae bacterium]